MSWTARMIELLVEAKREGYSFQWAWDDALLANPPRRREVGEVQLMLVKGDDAVESQEAFLYRVCEDAWHGRKPLLAHMPGLMDMVADDQSVLASQGPRRRMTMVA